MGLTPGANEPTPVRPLLCRTGERTDLGSRLRVEGCFRWSCSRGSFLRGDGVEPAHGADD